MSLVSDLDLSQFHELLDGSRDGAFLLDSTYFVVYVNSAGARLCRAEVTAGISLPSLFPIADLSLCLVQFSPGEWIRWVPEWNQHLHFRLRPVLGNYFALWVNEVTLTEISRDAGGVEKLEDEIRSSKERELFALQAAAMGVFSRNLITGEIYLSPRAMEQFGFSERKLLYFSDIQKIMHPDDIPRTLEGIQRSVADRSVYCNEYRVLWPDGSYHWLSVTGRATYDAEGQPLELHGVLLDITSRKNVEQALQRSTSALRSVLNASPLAIFNLDKAGLVQGWNYAAERIFGWAEAEVLGQSLPLTLPEALSQSAWIASGQTLSAMRARQYGNPGSSC